VWNSLFFVFLFGFGRVDAILARRNALLMQQREEAANYEIRLPQEWTY